MASEEKDNRGPYLFKTLYTLRGISPCLEWHLKWIDTMCGITPLVKWHLAWNDILCAIYFQISTWMTLTDVGLHCAHRLARFLSSIWPLLFHFILGSSSTSLRSLSLPFFESSICRHFEPHTRTYHFHPELSLCVLFCRAFNGSCSFLRDCLARCLDALFFAFTM